MSENSKDDLDRWDGGFAARQLEQSIDIPAEVEKCDHFWAWVSPAGTNNSARICMLCHEPSAEWLNTIFEMTKGKPVINDLLLEIKILIVDYFNEHAEKTDQFELTAEDVYIVWFSKTLQNYKAMVSTTVSDGMYYEVTYNGDKDETYLDAYKKFDNVTI